MILAVRTNHGLYLACDSRLTNPASDAAQKIFRCGSHAFIAISGTVIHRSSLPQPDGSELNGTLDLMKLLDRVSSKYFGDNSDLIEYLAGNVHGPHWTFWQQYIMPEPQAFLSAQLPFDTTVFTISGIATVNGMALVFQIRFPFLASGQLDKPIVQYFDHEITGWGKTVEADGIDYTLAHRSGVLAFISAMFTRSADRHPDAVGGPTDIGFLDGDGARWIIRKDLD